MNPAVNPSAPSAQPTSSAGPARLPRLQRTLGDALPEMSTPTPPEAMPDLRLLHLNRPLAEELGLDADALASPEGVAWLGGRLDADGGPLPAGTDLPDPPFTLAQAYAGHQFGQLNPLLGDGRALLLGEIERADGRRTDLHAKGTGRTPFSRAGDGRAPLGPMLRELVIGEALHGLGIPTTRALAVLTTGESVQRHGPRPEPGAIMVRAADSHLRVGSFVLASLHGDTDLRRRLVDVAIARHHPACAAAQNPPLALLEAVAAAQADLVAQWMLTGFVHGVMNTDNMTISGQGIDYGPCAFLDAHREGAVFSSIDAGGRYRYENQPGIALWNLSRFAETLLELIDPDTPDAAVDAATAVLEGFSPRYEAAFRRGMAAKLGLAGLGPADGGKAPSDDGSDRALSDDGSDSAPSDLDDLSRDLLALLEQQGVDRTRFFRLLARGEAAALFTDPAPFAAWAQRRERMLGAAGVDPGSATLREQMDAVNPRVIPRNHALEDAFAAAEDGDLDPVLRVLAAVRDPFADGPPQPELELPPPLDAPPTVTFCGT